MLCVLFLATDRVTNPELWRRWREKSGKQVPFFVNAKSADFDCPRGFERLPKGVEDRDTAWGHHSLLLAEQAMLRHAMQRHPEAEWFAIVSGDSVPLKPCQTTLKSLQKGTSYIDPFNEEASEMLCALMNECIVYDDNPFVNRFAAHGVDEHGPFFVFEGVIAHSQFMVLCRSHAEALCALPRDVVAGFDALTDRHKQYRVSAEEVVPLMALPRDEVKLCPVMYTKIVGKHTTKLHRFPICSHLFARKFDTLVT